MIILLLAALFVAHVTYVNEHREHIEEQASE